MFDLIRKVFSSQGKVLCGCHHGMAAIGIYEADITAVNNISPSLGNWSLPKDSKTGAGAHEWPSLRSREQVRKPCQPWDSPKQKGGVDAEQTEMQISSVRL